MINQLTRFKKAVKDFLKRDAGTHASSIAFFFFLSFIPLLILFASIVPMLGISVGDIIRFFQAILPDDASQLAEEVVREAFSHSAVAFSISAVTLLWTASRGVNALSRGLNAMYDEKETRGFAKLMLRSFGYTLVLLVFMSAAIYLIFSGRVSAFLKSVFPQIRLQAGIPIFLEYLLLLVTGCLFFCLVYKSLPSGKRIFSRQLPGAFLASAGWVFFSMALRVYVSVFNSFTRFYGSLATVVLILFWFYWIFFILLAGGYVNAHMTKLIPADYLSFYHEKKGLSLVVSGLFLTGFFAFLSECWLNCRTNAYPSFGFLSGIFRTLTLGTWAAATVISMKEMGKPLPRGQMLILGLFMAGNVFLMRRSVLPNMVVFLIAFTLWNIAILGMCTNILFSEENSRIPFESAGPKDEAVSIAGSAADRTGRKNLLE